MGNCGQCGGSCASCSGCGRELVLSSQEIEFLRLLGQFAFLPVARRTDDMTPFYAEPDAPENASLLLQLLEKKSLISLDYDKPLMADYGEAYAPYPVHGSMALTQRGQQVLEMLDYQGITEE